MDKSIDIKKALEDIKAAVNEKMAKVITKDDLEAAVEEALAEALKEKNEGETSELEELKAAVAKLSEELETVEKDLEGTVETEELETLKGSLEELAAKLDAIPAVEDETIAKGKSMSNINKVFTKNLKEKGVAQADIILKNITQSRNVTGAPSEWYGLTGSMFASNPFRELASVIETTGKALVLPVRAGSHGAGAAHATVKNTTASGNSAVTEVTIIVNSYDALTEVSVEAADDIIGFDQFWTQDMLDEVASIEAVAHVAIVEAMAGVNTDANSAVTLDDMADLHFAVEPQYRTNGAFVVSTDVMKTLRTLNTASTGGDLLFDAQLGVFRLFGQPIYENAYMDSIASGNVVAAFGDWKNGMVIANRNAATVGRYEQTKPGYYSYYANLRSGAAQWHSAAVKTLKVA